MLAAPAGASSWPAVGGGASRSGAQAVEPGALPATPGWSGAADVVAPPVIGDGPPLAQRVTYGTSDGRVHIRALQTGAEIGPAGGTLVKDSAIANPGATFGGLVTGGGTVFVTHNDGAGIEIARFDEASGARVGADLPLPDSVGCTVGGAPLLTPVGGDGTRLLVFTITGSCGAALVRIGVRGAQMGGPVRTAVPGLAAGVPPVQIVLGAPPRFAFAVARSGGLDFLAADGSPAGTVELGETPTAVAAPATAPNATPNVIVAGSDHVFRLDQDADGMLRATGSAAVRGTAIAIGGAAQPRVAVAGPGGLTVLASDLAPIGTAPGAFDGVAATGDLAYAIRAGRLVAVDLNTLAVTDLGPGAATPALARHEVVTGPAAVFTRDVTPPVAQVPAGVSGLTLAVIAGDDGGVDGVTFVLGQRRLGETDRPSTGTQFDPAARYEIPLLDAVTVVPPGRDVLHAYVRDVAGNTADAARTVTIPCGHRRRGTRHADRLRGRRGRDCVTAGRGRDRIDVRGGGADAVTCGPGRDLVRADAFDRVSDDCERVRRVRTP